MATSAARKAGKIPLLQASLMGERGEAFPVRLTDEGRDARVSGEAGQIPAKASANKIPSPASSERNSKAGVSAAPAVRSARVSSHRSSPWHDEKIEQERMAWSRASRAMRSACSRGIHRDASMLKSFASAATMRALQARWQEGPFKRQRLAHARVVAEAGENARKRFGRKIDPGIGDQRKNRIRPAPLDQRGDQPRAAGKGLRASAVWATTSPFAAQSTRSASVRTGER